MHRVFVYGTLKKGQPNHYLMQDAANGVAKYLGEGITVEKYPLIVASKYNIPFLLDAPGKGNNVLGDLFDIDDKMLTTLNRLENHPIVYTASSILIQPSWHSEPLICTTYLLKNYFPQFLGCSHLTSYDSFALAVENKSYVLPSDRPVVPGGDKIAHFRENVRGDVFEVDDLMLKTLHDLEKHPVIYTACPVDIKSTWTPEPATMTCMTYLIQNCLPYALTLPFMEHYNSHALEKEGRSYVLPGDRPLETGKLKYCHYRVVKDLPEVINVGNLLS